MMICKGKSVCGGIAIGRLHVLSKGTLPVVRQSIDDAESEIKRFEAARETAKSQLSELYTKAMSEVGEANAAIFEIHQMMLDDDDYLDSVHNIVSEQRVNAEYAVGVTADNFAEMFSSMDDAYMKERAADVRDISERIIRILAGAETAEIKGDEPVIILAYDLAPSETVQLDKDLVLSFVTVNGSANSHTAILARTMNIPALVSAEVELSQTLEGKRAVVDGNSGTIYIDPDEMVLAEMEKRRSEEAERRRLLLELKGKEDVTLDGHKVMLYANIGNLKDMAYVLHNDAGGIGLFRSEFLYLESETYPTEEAQFAVYKKVAEMMAGKRVIIRTLDIGADKQADYFKLASEENPAMGLRAIRICITRPDIFKTQLRAIYRASKYGKVAVMYPMITSVEEVLRVKAISAEVRAELAAEGIPHNKIEEGIMIETPAAAIMSDMLAREVDFFSIGTNDLSQYTMAIDRQNPALDEFFNPHHPAVLRMIEMVCKNAKSNGIWTGICGELGADTELTEQFLRMGVDELSVSPSRILPVRSKIRSINLSE